MKKTLVFVGKLINIGDDIQTLAGINFLKKGNL